MFDLSLANSALYAGCSIETVAGRLNLKTPVGEAVNIVGKNANDIISATPAENRDKLVLSGPMAVWAYLIVFHAAVHVFREVYYFDGKNPEVLISRHG